MATSSVKVTTAKVRDGANTNSAPTHAKPPAPQAPPPVAPARTMRQLVKALPQAPRVPSNSAGAVYRLRRAAEALDAVAVKQVDTMRCAPAVAQYKADILAVLEA